LQSSRPAGRRIPFTGDSVRDIAAGLGIGRGRLLKMEDGTATEEVRLSIGPG
jgi:hypothetical protein